MSTSVCPDVLSDKFCMTLHFQRLLSLIHPNQERRTMDWDFVSYALRLRQRLFNVSAVDSFGWSFVWVRKSVATIGVVYGKGYCLEAI